jgi:hypothetical protein
VGTGRQFQKGRFLMTHSPLVLSLPRFLLVFRSFEKEEMGREDPRNLHNVPTRHVRVLLLQLS